MSLQTMYNTTMNIQRFAFPTQDEIGGIVQTKTNNVIVPCRIRQLEASEKSAIGRDQAISTHAILCDADTKIDFKDTVTIEGEVYDINSKDDILNGRGLSLKATYKGLNGTRNNS